MITVQVVSVQPESMSMALGHGIDAGSGDAVRFGLETRYAIDIAHGLDRGEEITVELEPWQVLGRVADQTVEAEVWCQRCPEPATETYNEERLCHECALTLRYKIESPGWRR